MFDADGKLDIFEMFIHDPGLAMGREQTEGMTRVEDMRQDSGNVMMSSREFSIRSGGVRISSGVVNNSAFLPQPVFQPTLLQQLGIWLTRLVSPQGRLLVWAPLTGDGGQPTGAPEITVQEFFSSLKNTAEELTLVDGRARGYDAALERARKTGQRALVERLQAGIRAVRAETQLHAIKLTQTLSEETLVKFVKMSPKGLRLDWVRNFTRVIPDDVLEAKQRCDERHIFDNYVILHYDPEGKAWAETQQDIDDRKDPILFGVLGGTRKLYFVGDWIDEYCDLTLDQIADVLYEGQERAPSTAADELDPGSF